jgi:hypothetical protein
VVENRPSFVEKIVHTKFHSILHDPTEGPVMMNKNVVDQEWIIRPQNVHLGWGRMKMG